MGPGRGLFCCPGKENIMEEIKYMAQGKCHGRKTARVRYMERLDAERKSGQIMGTFMLIVGILIGAGVMVLALV